MNAINDLHGKLCDIEKELNESQEQAKQLDIIIQELETEKKNNLQKMENVRNTIKSNRGLLEKKERTLEKIHSNSAAIELEVRSLRNKLSWMNTVINEKVSCFKNFSHDINESCYKIQDLLLKNRFWKEESNASYEDVKKNSTVWAVVREASLEHENILLSEKIAELASEEKELQRLLRIELDGMQINNHKKFSEESTHNEQALQNDSHLPATILIEEAEDEDEDNMNDMDNDMYMGNNDQNFTSKSINYDSKYIVHTEQQEIVEFRSSPWFHELKRRRVGSITITNNPTFEGYDVV